MQWLRRKIFWIMTEKKKTFFIIFQTFIGSIHFNVNDFTIKDWTRLRCHITFWVSIIYILIYISSLSILYGYIKCVPNTYIVSHWHLSVIRRSTSIIYFSNVEKDFNKIDIHIPGRKNKHKPFIPLPRLYLGERLFVEILEATKQLRSTNM